MTITWTDVMVTALRQLRADGVPILLCAEKIGVSYPVAVFKCRDLGIATRLNRGRRCGSDVIIDQLKREA